MPAEADSVTRPVAWSRLLEDKLGAHVTSVRMHTIQFSRTEPALSRPEGLFSARVLRFGSGTFRRPASVCGGGNLRFRLCFVNLFSRVRHRRLLLAWW